MLKRRFIEINVPQTAALDLWQQLDSPWAWLASANRQGWLSFGEIDLQVNTLSGRSTTLDANYKDTFQLALGTPFQATPTLFWSAGVAYDSSAVSDKNRSVTVPVDEQWRVGTGVTFAVVKNTDLKLS
jgi:long-chain fatty acid transport protein